MDEFLMNLQLQQAFRVDSLVGGPGATRLQQEC